MNPPVLQTTLTDIPVRRGKVRDIYDLGEQLLLVSTDRISAFDWVLPTGIPDKGRVLTQISAFWFHLLDTPHHMLHTDPTTLPLPADADWEMLAGRSMAVRKCEVVPIECEWLAHGPCGGAHERGAPCMVLRCHADALVGDQ